MALTLEKRLSSCRDEEERVHHIMGWFKSIRDMAVANWMQAGIQTSVIQNGVDPSKS